MATSSLLNWVPDPRTTDWPLMDLQSAIWYPIAYTAFVYLCLLNKDKVPKFDLYLIRLVHNGFCSLLSLYMVLEILRQLYITGSVELVHGNAGIGVRTCVIFSDF
jgi:hypothetical protein